MALVDYGSGSESDSENEEIQPTPLVEYISKPKPSLDKGFFDEEAPVSNTLIGTTLKLPSVVETNKKTVVIEENELEGVVKPRDWEQQLAEKNKRKLEKRAKKKEKKLKDKQVEKLKQDKSKKPVIKISAFGALNALTAESDSEEDESPKQAVNRPSTSQSKAALLSMLPAPKTKGKGAPVSNTFFLPSTVKKTTAHSVETPMPMVPKRKRKADSDDSDDDEGVTDFFGLTSAPEPKTNRIDNESEIPLMAAGTGFESFGPSKPPVEEQLHPSQMYNYADVDPTQIPQYSAGYITDEQAFNLLSRDETVQVNDRRTLNEITSGIIDVNVDQVLGPSVKSDLLKGVTKAAYIRDVTSLPTKSGSMDKAARQKHQITYLAKLAVARDAALQDQWAASKSQKRMARQKYGF